MFCFQALKKHAMINEIVIMLSNRERLRGQLLVKSPFIKSNFATYTKQVKVGQ